MTPHCTTERCPLKRSRCGCLPGNFFPEGQFPPLWSYNYCEHVQRGYTFLKQITLGVGLLCRNNAADLTDRVFPWLEYLRQFSPHLHIAVYENDSTDATPELLASWQRQYPQFRHVRSDCTGRPKWGSVRSADRGNQMAYYREQCRQLLIEHCQPDVVLLFDSDMLAWSLDGICHSLGLFGEWDVMAGQGLMQHLIRSKSRLIQYDAWAWRENTWDALRARHVTFNIFPRGIPPIRLRSAFGGLALYRGEAFRKCAYPLDYGDCEHVGYHFMLSVAGFDRLFLNPSQLAIYNPITLPFPYTH